MLKRPSNRSWVGMGLIQRISDCAQTSETNHRASLTAARAGSQAKPPRPRGQFARLLFLLYAVDVIDSCKNSGPDHGLAIVERVNVVRSCRTEPRNWRWRVPEAPNRHIANTVRLDL